MNLNVVSRNGLHILVNCESMNERLAIVCDIDVLIVFGISVVADLVFPV